jgi:hypothetical protein
MDDRGSETCVPLPRAEVMARLNDRLRKTGTGGTIVVTKAVMNMAGFDAAALMEALANYEGFDADNDPHGERDFGDLILWGADLLWKIDYYDLDMQFGSDDPADAETTRRVLTVMTMADY